MSDAQSLFAAQWGQSCARFDVSVRANIDSLVNTLETLAWALARDDEARVQIGSNPLLWVDLHKLWRDLSRTQLTFWDADDEEAGSSDKEKDLRVVCASLAKFTRNLVAGVPENQLKAYDIEPEIRRLLHYHTSWSATEDRESVLIARLLAQTLSNMVTANEQLMSKMWEIYMKLPEDQVVLIRLLQSRDPGTLLTVLIFMLNCIHGSRKRSTMMTRTAVGSRVCITLLDDMLKLFDAEELTQGAQAFDVGYDILTQLVEQGLVPDLYAKFAMPDEIVTQHQTTLLKIVDSYLQSVQMNAASLATPETRRIHKNLSPMLAKSFFDLSIYAQHAVERALSPGASDGSGTSTATKTLPPAELDVMLPKVCEALVLVTQCIVTITLETDQGEMDSNRPQASESDLKTFFNETRFSDVGLVQSLLELLRLMDLFLPRINFGKPVTSSSSAATPPTRQSTPDANGFQYLKRDLVRLLGILCHGSKAVQDHVRERDGITIVMNLCVVDERNPYLREHAIFTLHNLLKNNPENQAVVDSIQPTWEWDEDGVLKDTTGSVRK